MSDKEFSLAERLEHGNLVVNEGLQTQASLPLRVL